MMDSDLTGKVIIVTGARAGLGREMCLEFAACGADVVVSSRVADGLEALADECRELGAMALAVVADVSDSAAVDRMVDATRHHFGRIDVLVNNAGIGQGVVAPDPARRRIPDLTIEQWNRMMDVNLGGTIRCTKAVLGEMMARGSGSIINLSSGTVGSPLAGIAAYTTSKFAIEGFTKVAALDLEDHGIRVNCIQPGGPVDTALIMPDFPAELRRELHQPSVIRACAAWLASDDAQTMTGQSFVAMCWNREHRVNCCECPRCGV